jgi:hypothetical protein
MNKKLRTGLIMTGVVLLGLFVAVNVIAYQQAIELITITDDERRVDLNDPADYGMEGFRDVMLTSEDDITLQMWYVPGESEAAIIFVHGLTGSRGTMLDEMRTLHREGYHVAALDTRGHGVSGGTRTSFGYYEADDIDAAYAYVSAQPGVERVALYGESNGGSAVLHYAARNEEIVAVATHTPFASLEDTIDTSVQFFTGLPPFPFADFIQFWAEREYGDMRANDVAPIEWARQTSPRPVFVMVAGSDTVVSPEQWLDEREELGPNIVMWYEPEARHAAFNQLKPEEFDRRLVAFYEQALAP